MSLPTSFPLKVAGGKTIDIPSVGFGTWASGNTSWCKDSVLTALKAGYRHLDCAWMYGVDAEIGQAIKESGIPRSEIFITTKFWPNFAAPENVELCLEKCLEAMGLDYVDLYLAHWPIAFKAGDLSNAKGGPGRSFSEQGIAGKDGKPVVDWEHCVDNIASKKGKKGSFVPTWQAMQALVGKGKTRAVGVSNFSIPELEELLPYSKDVPISCCQNEVHPWLPATERVQFMQKHGIVPSCYSPFAGQKADGATLLKDEKVLEIAKKNDMDVGQLLQSWAVGRGTIPLGKSQTESRIKSNLAVRKLSEEDTKAIDALAIANEEGRTINFSESWGVDLFQD